MQKLFAGFTLGALICSLSITRNSYPENESKSRDHIALDLKVIADQVAAIFNPLNQSTTSNSPAR